jgi:hypothetical protein
LKFTWHTGKRKLRETLAREFWQVYIGRRKSGWEFEPSSLVPVPSPKGRYYADPFLWEHDGKLALFVESYTYRKRKATIAAMTWDGKNWSDVRDVVQEPIHLSYPFLFEDKGVLYMIPESAEAGELVLYRCLEFPYQWQRERVLMENVKGYDPTLVFTEGRYWLFMNQQVHPGISSFDELFLYSAESLHSEWIPHPQNPIVSDVKSSRPAGRIFEYEGNWYRPAQDSAKHYGHRIRIQKILKWSETEYAEEATQIVEADWDNKLLGTHTLNFCGDWIVLDGYRRR